MAKEPRFFSLSFRNQDIHYAELGHLRQDSDFRDALALARGQISILATPERIIIHLEDTPLNGNRCTQLVELLLAVKEKTTKLAIVGIHGFRKCQLTSLLRRSGLRKHLPWAVINDYESAKEWIASTAVR